MIRRLSLSLVLAMVLHSSVAAAETCTFASGASSWTSETAATGAGTTGCTKDAGDSYVVANGAVVTIPAGSTVQLTLASSASVTVNSGGALTIAGALQTGNTGFMTVESGGTLIGQVGTGITNTASLSVGSGDLNCNEGSICRFSGKVRTIGQTPAALVDDPSTSRYFQVGDLTPCAGDSATDYDCATDQYTMMFYYDTGTSIPSEANDWNETSYVSGGASPTQQSYFKTSFDAIQPTDVIVFFDPIPEDAITYPQVNQPYDLMGAPVIANADYRSLRIDVRQGDEESYATGNYKLAVRGIRSGLLTSAATKGQRKFVFASGTTDNLVVKDMDMVGRWLRFPKIGGAAGKTQSTAYVVAQAKENAGYAATTPPATPDADDVLLLASKDGVPTGAASASRVWLDYGWRTGDPYYVMVPFRLTSSSTTDSEAAQFILNGDITLHNVVFDRPGRIQVGQELHPNGTIEQVKSVWVRDSLENDRTIAFQGRSGMAERVMLTGGVYRHGVFMSCMTGFELRDSSVRHAGDDNLVVDDISIRDDRGDLTCDTNSSNIVIKRVRGEYSNGDYLGSSGSGSGSLLDSSLYHGAGLVRLEDAYCADCVAQDSAANVTSPLLYNTAGGNFIGQVTAKRVVVLGLKNAVSDPLSMGSTLEDFLSIGSIVQELSQNAYSISNNINRFVIRDMEVRETTAKSLINPTSSAQTYNLRDGVFDDVTLFGTNATAIDLTATNTGAMSLRNMAFIDIKADGTTNTCASHCKVLRILRASGVDLRNITIAYRPEVAAAVQYDEGHVGPFSGTTPTDYKIGGMLITGMTKTTSYGGYQWDWNSGNGYALFNFTGPICAFNNAMDMSTHMWHASYGFLYTYATVIRDTSPEYHNIDAGEMWPNPSGRVAQAGCGVQLGTSAPGVHRQMWAASLAGLGPEFLSDIQTGGSSCGSPFFPCVAGPVGE